MSKIVKNNKQSGDLVINDTGVTVYFEDQYTIPPIEYFLWASSDDIVAAIGTGDAIINDGTNDLSSSEALDLMKGALPKEIQLTDGTNTVGVTGAKELKVSVAGISAGANSGLPSFNKNLRIEKTEDIIDLNNTTYVDIYNYDGTGSFTSTRFKCSTDKVLMKFTVDGEIIFDLNIHELEKFKFDHGHHDNRDTWFNFEEGGKWIMFKPDFPIYFATNITISLKSSENNKKFEKGLFIITKES